MKIEPKQLSDFDELNNFRFQVEKLVNDFRVWIESYENEKGKFNAKEIEDTVLDLLVMAYVFGTYDADLMLGIDSTPDMAKMEDSINYKIDGKNFRDRVKDYAENEGTADDFIRIAETDAHRVYNAGTYDTAKANGATKKTWNHMFDDKVRDPHWILGDVTVGIDELFYTDGYGAEYPGMFGVPELDVNCRCWISYSI